MLVVAATMAALPAFAAAAKTDAGNPKNGFGSAASQMAQNKEDDGKGGLGKHASSQDTPRQGVGNVARTDDAKGDHPGDHGCFVGQQMNVDCNDKPGKGGK